MSVHESIRHTQEAKNILDVTSKVKPFERRHQEYDRQAEGSNESEFAKMKTHAISDYPEVFRKADLVTVLPDVSMS